MWPFSKPASFLGVDIGTYGIKLVELKKAGQRPHLFTYAYVDQYLSSNNHSFIDVEKAAALVKSMCKKAKTVSRQALASLPASSVFSFLINIPPLKKEAESAYIKREAEKLVSQPLDELALDWRVILDKKTNERRAFLTAAPKRLIASYSEIFKLAGLSLVSLESENAALISSLIGKDQSPVLIADIGAAQTNFMLAEQGIPLLSHNLKLGGRSFTKALAENMGVDEKEAEQIKLDLKDQQAFPKVFESVASPIVEAIRYTFVLYGKQRQMADARPEKIILTGGSSLLPHLDEYLASQFNIKVYIGDPWARVIYDDALKPALDQVGPRFASALGLALKKVEG